jgi:tetratricopeptide (TPR) repeat protein
MMMTDDKRALTPEQLEDEGKTAYGEGDYRLAADSFLAAEEGYRLKGDEIKAAEMANNRSVALIQAGEDRGALDAVQDTVAIFEQAGDTLRQAMALGNRASAYEALGQLDLAIADYEQAEEIFRQLGKTDLRLDVSKSLSALQMRKGKTLEALGTMQAGVAEIERPTLKQRILKKLLGLPARLLGG